jgi:hypothetical protein
MTTGKADRLVVYPGVEDTSVWTRALLKTITVAKPVKGTRRFIAVFTRTHHWALATDEFNPNLLI